MIFDTFEIIMWFVAVAFCYAMTVTFFLEFRRREGLSRPFFRGLSVFGLCYGTARLIENIRRYFIGSYNDILEAWLRGEQITGLNFWLRFLYYLISWIGISIMFFNIERYIFTNDKYILTIFSVIEGIVSIINYIYFNMITYMMAVWIFFIPTGFLPFLFLDAARKATSKYVRNGCLITALGFAIMIVAVTIDLPEAHYYATYFGIYYSEFLIRLFAPILLIIGVVFFTIGLKTHFHESKKNAQIQVKKVREKEGIKDLSEEDFEVKLVDLADKKED